MILSAMINILMVLLMGMRE